MKRIFNFINGVVNDGRRHYTHGRDISAWVLLAACAAAGLPVGFVVSVLSVVAYAVVKVWQNRSYGGAYDLVDLFVTFVGGVSVWIWVLLFKLLLLWQA